MTTKYFTRPSCQENSRFSSSATNPVDLERERGETLSLRCRTCHKPRSVHFNDVKAQANLSITGIVTLVALIAVIALWRVGFIAYITMALTLILYRVQVQEAETFNR